MNNTLRARIHTIELLETRRLLSAITVGPTAAVAGIAPTQAVFTATLDAPSASPIKLSYSTINGSAKAGLDYRQTASHVVIPAGATSATFAVRVLPSTVFEADRVFYLKLTATAGNTVNTPIPTATIIENGVAPTVNVSDATVQIGLRRVQTSTFFVGLSGKSASPVTIDYTTHDVTAIGGVDYYPVTSSTVIPAFQTVGKIKVKIVGSAIVTPDKVFDIDITGATNATVPPGLFSRVVVEDSTGSTGIVRPTLTVSAPEVVRGNNLNFVLTLSAPTTGDVSVRYFTSPITASTTQYTSESGIITIPAGQTTATITVPTTLNTAVNVDSQIRLVLSAPANATVVQTNITGTILAYPTIVISDANIDETDASPTKPLTFNVTLNAPSPLPVSVTYNTVNGDLNGNDQANSAAGGVAYTIESGTLTFTPGQTQLSITVPTLMDATATSPLYMSVNLSGAVNGVVGRGTGLGTITDLSSAVAAPTVSVGDDSITLQPDQYGYINFTVALSAASSLPVTVSYETEDGTGSAGIDYDGVTGTLTFNPGEASLNLPIQVLASGTGAQVRTFQLLIFNPVNATIPVADNTGIGTIIEEA